MKGFQLHLKEVTHVLVEKIMCSNCNFCFAVDEVEKYLDPLFVESESFVSNEVKFEILQSHEQSLQDACVLHDKLEKARCVLDSEVIAGEYLLLQVQYVFSHLTNFVLHAQESLNWKVA